MTSTGNEGAQPFAWSEARGRIIGGRQWRQKTAASARHHVVLGLFLFTIGLLLTRSSGLDAWVGLLAWAGLVVGATKVIAATVVWIIARVGKLPEASAEHLDWACDLRGESARRAYRLIRKVWLREKRLREGKISDSSFEELNRRDQAELDLIREAQSSTPGAVAAENRQAAGALLGTHPTRCIRRQTEAALALGWADADAEKRWQIIEVLSLRPPRATTDASTPGRPRIDRNTP